MKITEIPSGAVIALINFYRRNISPFKPSCCRFTPTCSQYAIEAFRVHGFVKGFFLAAFRILRCHPFCKGGYDPVPVRFPDLSRFRRTKNQGEKQ